MAKLNHSPNSSMSSIRTKNEPQWMFWWNFSIFYCSLRIFHENLVQPRSSNVWNERNHFGKKSIQKIPSARTIRPEKCSISIKSLKPIWMPSKEVFIEISSFRITFDGFASELSKVLIQLRKSRCVRTYKEPMNSHEVIFLLNMLLGCSTRWAWAFQMRLWFIDCECGVCIRLTCTIAHLCVFRPLVHVFPRTFSSM